MKKFHKFILSLAFLGLGYTSSAQVQITSTGVLDNCFGSVQFNVVNPQPNWTYDWIAAAGSCFNHTINNIGTGTSATLFSTAGVFCVGTDQNGVQQTPSNTIFARILPGGWGSLLLPLPYSQNQIFCLPSIDMCIPYELANPSFTTTIKWYKNNVVIPGATASNYTATTDGYYKYSITNNCITAFSDSVFFISNSSGPEFTSTGVSPVCNGNTINFTVTNPIAGAVYTWQTSNFPSSGFTAAASGTSFQCIVPSATNIYVRLQRVVSGCNLLISPAVGYSIQNISRQVTPFTTQTICPGGSVDLTVFVSGGTATTQWRKNGVAIPGATAATYTAASAGVYDVAVSALCGVSYSNSVTVNASANPTATITAGGATTFCAGGNVNLNANTGTGLTYQWKKFSNNIAGATNASYSASTAGKYKCIVTNAGGCSKSSNSIDVVVNPLPTATITANGPTTFCAGDSVKLSANSGSGLTYQWKKYSSNIAGATLINYTAKQAGKYKCTVTNSNGCSKASNAITVAIPCREGNFDSFTNLSEIKIYPNPARDEINIEIPGNIEASFQFELFDMIGNLVYSDVSNSNYLNLDVSHFQNGIYFIKIHNEDLFYNSKINILH